MTSNAIIPFLVGMMLLTGCCNTLLTKYQDMQCVHNCSDPDPKARHYFEQPVLQTVQMFIGEMGCWLVIAAFSLYNRFIAHKTKADYMRVSSSSGRAEDPLLARTTDGFRDDDDDDDDDEEDDDEQTLEGSILASALLPTAADPERMPMTGVKVMLMGLPACCDIAGTTLMNIGLLFVAASIYQMTRGALVLFVGLFSVIFLKRHLSLYKWFALFVVVAGVAVVGVAGALDQRQATAPETLTIQTLDHSLVSSLGSPSNEPNAFRIGIRTADELSPAVKTTIGVLLIALAQIFTATQFVLEESIMERYALEPLKAVGWEGLWGFVVTVLGMAILHFAYGRTDAGRGGYFDATEGLWQVFHYRAIAVSSLLIMISIGGFNFFGLSVTRTVSATSRSTIDTCRTLFIWLVSLGLGWESFKWLQVAGFALLVYGTFLFNDIIRPPLMACVRSRRDEEAGSDEVFPERPPAELM